VGMWRRGASRLVVCVPRGRAQRACGRLEWRLRASHLLLCFSLLHFSDIGTVPWLLEITQFLSSSSEPYQTLIHTCRFDCFSPLDDVACVPNQKTLGRSDARPPLHRARSPPGPPHARAVSAMGGGLLLGRRRRAPASLGRPRRMRGRATVVVALPPTTTTTQHLFAAARPAREVSRPLCAEGAAILAPHRSHLPRAGGERVPGGRGGLRPAARGVATGGAGEEFVGGDSPVQGVLHVRRAAGLGQGKRVPVEYVDLCACRSQRASGGSAVGVGSPLPVGFVDVRLGRFGRAPGSAQVGAGARMPVGGNLHMRRGRRVPGVLQLAREHGCPWNARVCHCAAEGGHLQVLRWLREHGCPWEKRACAHIAGRYGYYEIRAWVRAQP
jgi:hypothetical protein